MDDLILKEISTLIGSGEIVTKVILTENKNVITAVASLSQKPI